MTLIFLYISLHISQAFLLCCLFSEYFTPGLLRHMLRHFHCEVLAITAHFFKAKIPLKLNAPDALLSK